jgi:Rod binding domain-containing protein
MNAAPLTNLTGSSLFQIETRSRASASSHSNSPAEQKIRKAASEFESLLLANWWNTMKQGGLSGGEEDSDPGKDTLDHLGIQAMSAAVAKGGGLGIGAMLVRSLLSKAEHPDGDAAAASPAKEEENVSTTARTT